MALTTVLHICKSEERRGWKELKRKRKEEEERRKGKKYIDRKKEKQKERKEERKEGRKEGQKSKWTQRKGEKTWMGKSSEGDKRRVRT